MIAEIMTISNWEKTTNFLFVCFLPMGGQLRDPLEESVTRADGSSWSPFLLLTLPGTGQHSETADPFFQV